MLPTREKAEQILREAEGCNPGPWGNHSRVVALCAERIAACVEGMDPEKAYIAGLMHDIGRKFGVKHLGHVYDGYHYMMELGYDEAARVCLTHSFSTGNIGEYIGNFDISGDQIEEIEEALEKISFDDYDRLVQLCDSLSGTDGAVDMEVRMGDVKRRYGRYPQSKWDKNLALKKLFDEKVGRDIYEILPPDSKNPAKAKAQ